MRVALHSVIRADAVQRYRERHARVPDELSALFARAGIHDWTIWRSGDRLFHLVECDDWDAAVAVIGPDPANTRWQADIGRFVAGFVGPDGEDAIVPLDAVWSLRTQIERDR